MSGTEQSDPDDHQVDEAWSAVVSERGRRSAEEGARLLITISTASLGVFFMVLGNEVKPALDASQQIAAIVAVIGMGIASGAGILSWWADAKHHINWALARSQADRTEKRRFYSARERWRGLEKLIKRIFFVAFTVGIVAGVVFLVLRISSLELRSASDGRRQIVMADRPHRCPNLPQGNLHVACSTSARPGSGLVLICRNNLNPIRLGRARARSRW